MTPTKAPSVPLDAQKVLERLRTQSDEREREIRKANANGNYLTWQGYTDVWHRAERDLMDASSLIESLLRRQGTLRLLLERGGNEARNLFPTMDDDDEASAVERLCLLLEDVLNDRDAVGTANALEANAGLVAAALTPTEEPPERTESEEVAK